MHGASPEKEEVIEVEPAETNQYLYAPFGKVRGKVISKPGEPQLTFQLIAFRGCAAVHSAGAQLSAYKPIKITGFNPTGSLTNICLYKLWGSFPTTREYLPTENAWQGTAIVRTNYYTKIYEEVELSDKGGIYYKPAHVLVKFSWIANAEYVKEFWPDGYERFKPNVVYSVHRYYRTGIVYGIDSRLTYFDEWYDRLTRGKESIRKDE